MVVMSRHSRIRMKLTKEIQEILNQTHFRKVEQAYQEEQQLKSPRDNTYSYFVLQDRSQK